MLILLEITRLRARRLLERQEVSSKRAQVTLLPNMSRSFQSQGHRLQSGIVADGIYASARDGGVRYIAGQTGVNPPLQRLATTQDSILPDPSPQSSIRQGSEISPTAMSLNGFSLSNDYGRPGVCGIGSMNGPHSSPNGLQISQIQPQFQSQQSFQNFGENSYPAMSPPYLAPPPGFRFGSAGESPFFDGFFGASPIIGSPGWLNLPSPSN
ncbi:hypothetical protein ABVK25_011318 [Lepraria finkii]|uniref:Uncharacterized protein n=1 Tax=Lepraria finkii TaxID=1340010 RepID=A0ABR4AQ00_9LECA